MSLQLSDQNWVGSLEDRNNYSSLTCTHLEKDALVRFIMSFLDVLCRQHLKWCRINYVEGKGNFTSELILLTSGNDSFSCLLNSFFWKCDYCLGNLTPVRHLPSTDSHLSTRCSQLLCVYLYLFEERMGSATFCMHRKKVERTPSITKGGGSGVSFPPTCSCSHLSTHDAFWQNFSVWLRSSVRDSQAPISHMANL